MIPATDGISLPIYKNNWSFHKYTKQKNVIIQFVIVSLVCPLQKSTIENKNMERIGTNHKGSQNLASAE